MLVASCMPVMVSSNVSAPPECRSRTAAEGRRRTELNGLRLPICSGGNVCPGCGAI